MIKYVRDSNDKITQFGLIQLLKKRFNLSMKFFRIVKECINLTEWHKKSNIHIDKKHNTEYADNQDSIRRNMLEVKKLKNMNIVAQEADIIDVEELKDTKKKNLTLAATRVQLAARSMLSQLANSISRSFKNG